MNFSPFSCPIFLGHPQARGRCSQGEWMLFGRVGLLTSAPSGSKDGWEEPRKQKPRSLPAAGGLPGAGISLKQCPGKCAAEKALTEISDKRDKEQTGVKQLVRASHNARPPWGRRGWRDAPGDSWQLARQPAK